MTASKDLSKNSTFGNPLQLPEEDAWLEEFPASTVLPTQVSVQAVMVSNFLCFSTSHLPHLDFSSNDVPFPHNFFFRGTPMVYASSQARGWIGAAAASLHHRFSQNRAMSVTYTSAHSNARSLTQRVGPGIKPAFSWTLVGFVSTEPQWELPPLTVLILSFPG